MRSETAEKGKSDRALALAQPNYAKMALGPLCRQRRRLVQECRVVLGCRGLVAIAIQQDS